MAERYSDAGTWPRGVRDIPVGWELAAPIAEYADRVRARCEHAQSKCREDSCECHCRVCDDPAPVA